MRAISPKAEHEARVTKALLRLSSARREKLSAIDFEVFVDGLREFDAGIVEQVTEDFGRIAPEEFQPRFPPLHQLREQCFRAREAGQARRQLREAPISERFPPLAPEKFEEIKARFREVLDRKVMPTASDRHQPTTAIGSMGNLFDRKMAAAGDRE